MGVQCSVYSVWPLVNTQQMLAGIIPFYSKILSYESPFPMLTLCNNGFRGPADVTCIS